MLSESHVDFKEPIPIDMRKKSNKRGPLTVADKINIVHKVLIEHELYKDVAREYRVGVMTVQHLLKKVKDNKRFLDEARQDADSKVKLKTQLNTAIK